MILVDIGVKFYGICINVEIFNKYCLYFILDYYVGVFWYFGRCFLKVWIIFIGVLYFDS